MKTLSRATVHKVVNPILFGCALLALWDVLCQALHVPRFVIPRPYEIGIMLVERWDMIQPNAVQTVRTTLTGFVIGVAIGFLLGLLLGASAQFHRTVFATLIGVNSIPKAALVPLIILWVGLGSTPAIIASAIIVIFPIAVIVSTGIASTDKELGDVLRSLGASRVATLQKVAIPQTMPMFIGSLRIAISLSFVGTIVAESVASNAGLGYMMNKAAADFDVELVFTGVAMIAAIGVLFYLLTVYAERRLTGWAYRGADSP